METYTFDFTFNEKKYSAEFVMYQAGNDVQFHLYNILPQDFDIKMPYIIFLKLETKNWNWPDDLIVFGLGKAITKGIYEKCIALNFFAGL